MASNKVLQQRLKQLADYYDFRLSIPPPHLCTDNGSMIAWAAMERIVALEAGAFHAHEEIEWMEGVGVCWSEEEINKLSSHRRLPLGECVAEEVGEMKLKLSKNFKRVIDKF